MCWKSDRWAVPRMVAADVGRLWENRGLKWQCHFENKWPIEKAKEGNLPRGEILLWIINFRTIRTLKKKKKRTQKLKIYMPTGVAQQLSIGPGTKRSLI